MHEKVVIIGGKGTAVVIAEQIDDVARRFNADIEVLGFAFDDPAFSGGINGWPVLCGTKEAFHRFRDDEQVKFVYQLYRSDLLEERIALRESLAIPAERYLSFVHPSAYIARSAELGYGNIILANCVINNNVRMGNLNTMNSNAMIGHDTIVGDSNFFAAHTCIGSGIRIGFGNFTGLNCTVREYSVIGNYNVIGMGSSVVKDVGDYTVVVGNPAGILKENR